jgi:AcrR family transcriptional regulator
VNRRSHLCRRRRDRVIEQLLGILPAKQKRSERTVVSLLHAAQTVLETDGWAKASISSIASKANVSVGAVYRRFADKESLFAAVYERYYARSVRRRETQLTRKRCGRTFDEAVRFVIVDIITRNKKHANFLRPYWVSLVPSDPKHRARIDALNHRGFELIAAFLSSYKGSSGARRREAVRFALSSVAHTLRATVLPNVSPPLVIKMSEAKLVNELVSMFLAYVRSA